MLKRYNPVVGGRFGVEFFGMKEDEKGHWIIYDEVKELLNMRDLYDVMSERLWEKLEYFREHFHEVTISDLTSPTLANTFSLKNPVLSHLIREVEVEYKLAMTELQIHWAIFHFLKGGPEMMKNYNQVNNCNLRPRV